ncbi:MAG: hypothetical protein EZS28_033723 [Streblomastix strix]|uniref:Uncharacterized protein n=1 Tax=Streblomastix strix TaxID=222440 RepID=A0A5J4UJM1_9EUKA|nr:MAG: hypothetical protein EZS28_033723 [Streblomastix strix]
MGQKKEKKNGSSDKSRFSIVQDGECEVSISIQLEMREIPNTSLKTYFQSNDSVYGKGLYVITDKFNELCLLNFNLDNGDYLRGDYDDDNSPEMEYLRRYWTAPILLPITIADGVIEGYNKLLYYQYRDSQLQGRDIYGCRWCDDECRTFEFGLLEVSLGIGWNETAFIENKTIMISDDTNGYDQKTVTKKGFIYKMA